MSRQSGFTRALLVSWTAMIVLATGMVFYTGQSAAIIISLKNVVVPQPLDLGNYVTNQFAAEQLGKALFWDMQVGSDGVQACATCHFHAGADNRSRNQLSPGINAGDELYGNNNAGMPEPAPGSMHADQQLTAAHFPLHRLTDQHVTGDPAFNPGNTVRDTNDVVSSMGVTRTQFVDIVPGNPVDIGTVIPDPAFVNPDGIQVRRVEPRNTPTVINAVFNFDNFWDGRANNIFNGNNPFGPADPKQHLLTNISGALATEELRLRQSALASQAVGPPLSDFEMSFAGRTWPKIGKKMLSLRPLAQQAVATDDSRLGFLSQGAPGGTGLNTTYEAMIQTVFPAKYWNNTTEKVTFDASGIPSFQPWNGVTPLTTDEYTQMEANFGIFFGVAVQMYEVTLVADDSRFDRFMDGSGALTNEETIGMNAFNAQGGCILCHDGGTLSDIDVTFIQGVDPVTDIPIPFNQNPVAANEFMQIATGFGMYDAGFHNTGVRPQGNPDLLAIDFLAVNEDVGRGGTTGLGGAMTEISLSKGILGMQNEFPGTFLAQTPNLAPLPAHVNAFVPQLPDGFLPTDTNPFAGRVTNFGAFKTPAIRNVALTGPYMHNGGLSTLRQVVDFYVRGGDFATTNNMNFDSEGITVLPLMRDTGALAGLPTPEELRDGLVQFMMALTDARVANEAAPFDHPEIFVPITGTAPVTPGTRDLLLANATGPQPDFMQVNAVGSGGRGSVGLPPLGTFLGLDPRSDGLVADADLDLIEDAADNCPAVANPGQEDVGDTDGVGDACDNCTLVANADQRDTDADGFGNICDADLNGDLTVNLSDFSLFRSAFGTADPDADLNGDGAVNLSDFSLFRGMFGGAPGPSTVAP